MRVNKLLLALLVVLPLFCASPQIAQQEKTVSLRKMQDSLFKLKYSYRKLIDSIQKDARIMDSTLDIIESTIKRRKIKHS